MKKIFFSLIFFMLLGCSVFVYAQTESIDQIITNLETKIKDKPLEQQRKARGNFIKKIPGLISESGSKTLSTYVIKKKITTKIQAINKKIKSRLEDRTHIKTETYYVREDELERVDPMLSNLKLIRKNMLKSVNTERLQSDNGEKELLNVLTLNDKLNIAAQKQAEYLSQANDFYHISKNGSTPADRVETEGYTFMLLGENIASGQRSLDEVMGGWMRSEGHRANIMGTGFQELGVGYMSGYRVQLFGTQFLDQ